MPSDRLSNHPHWANYRALADYLGPRVVGWERSAKITPAFASTQRWLFGFDKQGLNWEALARQPFLAGYPPDVQSDIAAQWESANFAYCALDLEPAPTLKFYLEFPVLVATQMGGVTQWGAPALWCRGYKVDGHRLRHSQTDYHLLPGRSVDEALQFMPQRHAADALMRQFADFLARRARSTRPAIDILQVLHDSRSQGLDFRLYGQGLTLSDWLGEVIQKTAVPQGWLHQRQVVADLQRVWGSAELGHVSIGVDDRGEPYMNLYWAADDGAQICRLA